jgi:hypothetical protein
MKKQLLIASTVLGALSFGHQMASADTVNNDNSPVSSQATGDSLAQANSVTLSASDTSAAVDDGTTVDPSGSSSSTDTPTTPSDPSSSLADTPASTPSEGSGSSSETTGGPSSSSPDTPASTSPSTATDPSSSTGAQDNSSVVPLTPATPDANDQGQAVQVKPVTVAPDNAGQVADVPEQVATVPSVARAVQAYNQALNDNDKDATKAPVVGAKKNLDNAVAKALPETSAIQTSSIGLVGLALGALTLAGAFVFKRLKLR